MVIGMEGIVPPEVSRSRQKDCVLLAVQLQRELRHGFLSSPATRVL